jgi:hypothetical protein
LLPIISGGQHLLIIILNTISKAFMATHMWFMVLALKQKKYMEDEFEVLTVATMKGFGL